VSIVKGIVWARVVGVTVAAVAVGGFLVAGAWADAVLPVYTGDPQSIIMGSWGDGQVAQGQPQYVNNPVLDITTSSFFAGGYLRLTNPEPLGVSVTKPDDTLVVLILRIQSPRGARPGPGGNRPGAPGTAPGAQGTPPPGASEMYPPPLDDGAGTPQASSGNGYGSETPAPAAGPNPFTPGVGPPGGPRIPGRRGRGARGGAGGFGRGTFGGGGWGGAGGGAWVSGRGRSSFGVAFTSNQISQVRLMLLTDKGQIDSGALELDPNLNLSGDWFRLVVPFSQFSHNQDLTGAQLEGAVVSGNTTGTIQLAQIYLKQENPPLVAQIQGPRMRSAKVGESLTFESAPQRPGVKPNYQWSFDTLSAPNLDALGPQATWHYDEPGDYLVTFQVSDAQHEQQMDQILVVVN
jgi:hypothetical protein